MLSIEKINFPITFKKCANGKNITFHSANGNGVWSSNDKSILSLSYFIGLHNKANPENRSDLMYYYEMAEKKEENREHNDLLDALKYFNVKPGQVNLNGTVFTSGVTVAKSLLSSASEYVNICNVEHMPVGATLLAIQRENGEWDELKFNPRRIEVHNDIITLLSGYAGGHNGCNNYGAEINIKRGTKVKYK